MKSSSKLLDLFILCLFYYCVKCEIGDSFSSVANLIKLAEGESKMIGAIKKHLQKPAIDEGKNVILEEVLLEMTRAEEFLDTSGAAHYVGHPLNAFALIKRWAKITPPILKYMQIRLAFLSPLFKHLPIPTEFDLKVIGTAIIRLQRIYKLQSEKVSKGLIYNEQCIHTLNSDDYIMFANIAFRLREYHIASQWFEKVIEEPTSSRRPDSTVFLDSARCYLEMGNVSQALILLKQGIYLHPECPEIRKRYQLLMDYSEKHDSSKKNTTAWFKNLPKWQKYFEQMCRGELDNLHTDESEELACYLKPISLPYITYKMEILNKNPKIILFHDVISDNEADLIKEKAYPLLSNSVLGNVSKSAIDGYRLNKIAWLSDLDDEIEQFTKRISVVTGLDTTYGNPFTKSEPFHIQNYGVGGQTEPHHDFLSFKRKKDKLPEQYFHYLKATGDRIATFMFFLSDVKHGGATVFPHLNLIVPPFKNGALFWYNLKRNGQIDKRLLHGFCPVLLGQHWISLKWIKEKGQEFRRLCGENTDTPDI